MKSDCAVYAAVKQNHGVLNDDVLSAGII